MMAAIDSLVSANFFPRDTTVQGIAYECSEIYKCEFHLFFADTAELNSLVSFPPHLKIICFYKNTRNHNFL